MGNPVRNEYTTAIFLIDSGADLSMIDKEVFDILDLEYCGDVNVAGINDRSYQRLFVSRIKLESKFGMNKILKVAVGQGGENILGRDILNDWKITLDGVRQKSIFEK